MNQVQPLTFTSELILFCYNNKVNERLNINVIISLLNKCFFSIFFLENIFKLVDEC